MMVVSTLNLNWKSFALAIVGAEYVLRWLPRGTHDWQRFVTPQELSGHLGARRFTVATERGMIFNPLATGWALAGDTDVNYFVVAARE